MQMLEEKEAVEELVSSRGRLGPDAWQTLLFSSEHMYAFLVHLLLQVS